MRLFRKGLHDVEDTRGKLALIKYFRNLGYEVEQNPFGRYGVDLRVVIDGKDYFFDAEVRSEWKWDRFPFETIHIVERKRKFNTKNTYFASIRNDLRVCYFIPASLLKTKYLESVETRDGVENFYSIPVEYCQFRNLRKQDTFITDVDSFSMEQLMSSGLSLRDMNNL